MYHQSDPTTTVPLLLHKNSLRFRANPIVHHVSPVVDVDVPLRLSSRLPLKLLVRRLDELALPKQGTKLDKWTRLQKRERELVRERKSQAAIDAEREAGPEGRRREAAIPISDPCPSNKEKDGHKLTQMLPQPWYEQCVKGERYRESSFERAESTLFVIAFGSCFIIVPGVTADEGATCLVLLDVGTGYMKVVPTAGMTVTDYLFAGRRWKTLR